MHNVTHYIRKAVRLVCMAGFLFCAGSKQTTAQEAPRYLVLFKDKSGTPYSTANAEAFLSERAIARRTRQNIQVTETDLPVDPAYVSAVAATGAQVLYPTKWFNGVIVSASSAQIEAIQALPFYKGIEKEMALTGSAYNARLAQHNRKFGETDDAIDYGNSRLQLEMMGVPRLHDLGYSGDGFLIGVFDSGFTRADEQPYLSHLFDRGQVVETYDFISREEDVYDDHNHGLQVLSVMASKLEGSLVGPAFDAQYALYRTENVSSETPYEEVAWLVAAERADSLGVDIINTSLGYYEFDNAAHNYTYAQMDGKTAIISKAARYAARTGILLVTSAGNEGDSDWKYISAPADVDSTLAVGAVTSSGSRSAFSSFGPNAEGTVKPDVVALGSGVRVGTTAGSVTSSNGTSFSSPLIASFSALLWQVHPEKTAQEIADLIRSLGHQASEPDDELGYGIPYYDEVLSINSPTSFNASLTGNVVNLVWEYENEETANAYEVERSFNNGSFTLIASVGPALSLIDTLLEPGFYRYRVRAVSDFQKSAYSAIASLQFTVTGKEQEAPAVTVWPNPVTHKVFVDLTALGKTAVVQAQIMTLAGLTLRSVRLIPSVSGTGEIETYSLSPGLYLLRLSTDSGDLVVRKIIRQ